MQPLALRPGAPAPLAATAPAEPAAATTTLPDTDARIGWAPTAAAAPHAHRARLEAAVRGLDGLSRAVQEAAWKQPVVPGRLEGRARGLGRALAAISGGLLGAGLDARIAHAPAVRRAMRTLEERSPAVALHRRDTLRELEALLGGARLPDGRTAAPAWQDRLAPLVAGLEADHTDASQAAEVLSRLLSTGRGPAASVAADLVLRRLGRPEPFAKHGLEGALFGIARSLDDTLRPPPSVLRLMSEAARRAPSEVDDWALRSLLRSCLAPLPPEEITRVALELTAGEMPGAQRAALLAEATSAFRTRKLGEDVEAASPQLAELLRQRAGDMSPRDLGDILRSEGHRLDGATLGACLDTVGARALEGILTPGDARTFLLFLGDRGGRRSALLGVSGLADDLRRNPDGPGPEVVRALSAPERAAGMTAIVEQAVQHYAALSARRAAEAAPAAAPAPIAVPPARLEALRSVLGLLVAGGDLPAGVPEALLAHPRIRARLADPELDAPSLVTTIAEWPSVSLDPLARRTLLDALSRLA